MAENGAHALIRTLVDSGVDVCFANPGTSEMHFVAALDSVPEMRGVLGLFEGVVTGAADGYGRMAGKPAVTLLHLGPGLSNGLANLHNARRAHTPVVNVVGDHATYHKRYDAPLESDIDALAGAVSGWVRRSERGADVGLDAAEAVAASIGARPGPVTLILPADVSWSAGGLPSGPRLPDPQAAVPGPVIASLAGLLRAGDPVTLLLGGAALSEDGLNAASRIARATGCALLAEPFPARIRRGAGVPAVERLAYRGEAASAQLRGARRLLLAGARSPVTFFAYPGAASDLVPAGTSVHTLAEDEGVDVLDALRRLADLVAPGAEPVPAPAARPELPTGELPTGELTVENWVKVIGALLPQDAIISDESMTAGMFTLPAATAGAAPHDLLPITGGSIGQGLPVATGAAIACPDRPVICLEADGSAMYTISALWTQAREHLNVTTVLLNNSSYAALRMELGQVGAVAGGARANLLLDLTRPDLDFVAIADGMGVPAVRVGTAAELAEQFTKALAEPGPHLIEAMLPAHQ
ncbi:acetolactate synthase large subunit [Streptomyces sp. NPDC056716]|uniref:acetolactate synthase large subunit n=1 Tax=unclassified Streptomyces TaxID=2593676 RepID=UPI003685F1EB